jgi:ribosomal protein S25
VSGRPAEQSATPVHPAETAAEWITGAAMGGAGMASGFMHLVENATNHGVSTALSWVTAVTVELCVLYAGLKLRRRINDHRAVWPPAVLLVCGFGLSMASQLATADQSGWGWIYAAWPVVGFLWVAKLTVSDLAHRAEVVDQERQAQVAHEAEVQRLTDLAHDLAQRLAHAEAVNQEMDQRMSQAVDQHAAEVQRLTAKLAEAELRSAQKPTERKVAAPEKGSETMLERATRVAVEFRFRHHRRPTQNELAEAAGVSKSTAKRALGELGDEAVLSQVEGTG